MNIRARTDIADLLLVAGCSGLFVAWFLSGECPFWMSVSGAALSLALVILGGCIRPPFWWGVRSFTTPLDDPEHTVRDASRADETHRLR